MSGGKLADGRDITTPIVINAAGSHSGALNELAGVKDDLTIRTRPLRQEVHEVLLRTDSTPTGALVRLQQTPVIGPALVKRRVTGKAGRMREADITQAARPALTV
ncbi:hypothetical protein [Streptomyces paromomycinus]|uniref:Uncharacterized protein n=1 Tax=Streptomyces paromomycinus TaxID=92743 RepID=A0A401WGM4_STREY|nr:hypothetical protein [Streptomyces paromomycinus]GCD48430.1 hypothetical protein GKJPGBOP_08228 [Streptomyces paromomycinus]